MRRGMRPFERSSIRFGLADITIKAALPIVPKVWGHVRQAQPPGGWGVLGNLTAGDCVIAGFSHQIQVWFWATKRTIPPFTDPSSLSNYSHALVAQGQGPYVPGDSSTDTGLDPVQAAQWWQSVGITDADGVLHKLGSFVSVDTPEQLDIGGYLGGAGGMCWLLPDSAEDQFREGHVWDDLSGDPGAGHYTAYVGRNSAGLREFVTWGRLQAATDAYVEKYWYPSGGIVYLSQEYLLATGKSPEGIDWAGLAQDEQGL